MSEELKIRPYARLLTMLGDQLIKDERIALVELIKNAYDADASWVKVCFEGFDEDFHVTEYSKIIIEDDGCGMDDKILKKHWLNPATPDKLKRKKETPVTQKGRILQGEKGIGRFAVFKLGKKISITTRRQLKDTKGNFIEKGGAVEYTLTYDFSRYDDDFLEENGKDAELFLEDLSVYLSQREPETIVEKEILLGTQKRRGKSHGTVIEISNLKDRWTEERLERAQRDVGKLQPIFSKENGNNTDFSVWFYKGKDLHEPKENYKESLLNLLEQKTIFRISKGIFDCEDSKISFMINERLCELDFDDPDINGITEFKKIKKRYEEDGTLDCGSFEFEFYIFDLQASSENPSKYYLSREEKSIIRDHRIYLYRDDVRVMPYGDPDDDWLGIDKARGNVRANEYLSNEQVVGCIYISQEENPLLRDKTSREGLIDEGNALSDFIVVIQLILKYIRKKPYSQYLIDKKRKNEINFVKTGKSSELIESAKKELKDNSQALEFINKFEKSYAKEKRILNERIAKTENLAAVGLSIETASHDVMILISKAMEQTNSLYKEVASGTDIDNEKLCERLTLIAGTISMVQTQMKDVQLLFPSTKQRTRLINVRTIMDKVHNIYANALKKNGITTHIDATEKPLMAKTTDAVLLQVFINLFDNAFYWLMTLKPNEKKEIHISLDGNNQRMIFSDSGPGIKDDDKGYIFDAFYSGKGEEGRGLGLYIAKQLLDRYDYSIELAELSKDKLLKGANFVVEFVKGEYE